MEMNLESIKKYVNEAVGTVDFVKLLTEAEPDDVPEEDLGGDDSPTDDSPSEDGPADDFGVEDIGGTDDFGGPDDGGDFGGGDTSGSPSGGSHGDSGEDLGDDEEAVGDGRFADREDDPDFVGGSNEEGSAAEGKPSGAMIYDTEGVLDGINNTINASDVNLAEIDKAKNVLEVIANGKKLKPEDFDDIQDYQSFSDIINRSLFQTDDNTQNYFKMKIKSAILNIQNENKIDAAKKSGEVDTMRDLASKF